MTPKATRASPPASAQVYRYAVDYLGAALRQAAEQWELDHPGASAAGRR